MGAEPDMGIANHYIGSWIHLLVMSPSLYVNGTVDILTTHISDIAFAVCERSLNVHGIPSNVHYKIHLQYPILLGWNPSCVLEKQHYRPRMRECNGFILCACVCVCSGYNFWMPWRNFTLGRVVHYDHILVKFEYQGHWVKVNVTLVKLASWTVGH